MNGRRWCSTGSVAPAFLVVRASKSSVSILGVDGWRAHLNHFYGVHIEQCLFWPQFSRAFKNGATRPESQPSDDASERAFLGLYEETEETLWGKFTDENSERLSKLIAESKDDNRSIALEEEFTYWLFKRRIENTNAAASGRRNSTWIGHDVENGSSG